MNIEQQRLNFQRAYVKTDYYKTHYEKTKITNSTFSWNNEANRYTWHDVNSAWEMWQAKDQEVPEGFVLVSKEPTGAMLRAIETDSDYVFSVPCGYENATIDKDTAREIYKAMIQAAQE